MERSGLRSHLSGSVPISIALHLVALLVFVVIPLTANMILPDPSSHLPEYMRVAPIPPPPPAELAPSRTSPTPTRASDPTLAPTTAPDTIESETTTPATVTDPSAIPSIGRPSDGLGLPVGGAPVA